MVKESGPYPHHLCPAQGKKSDCFKTSYAKVWLSSVNDWPRGVHVTKFWPMRYNTKNTARASGKDFAS